MNSDIDDPQLTAYALDELSEAQRREVEARLSDDEPAQREIEDIQGIARLLSERLAHETLPAAAPNVAGTIKPNRWAKWRGRLAVAAVVALVSGVACALLLPALATARRATKLQRWTSLSGSESRPSAAPEPTLRDSSNAASPPLAVSPTDAPDFTQGPTFSLQSQSNQAEPFGVPARGIAAGDRSTREQEYKMTLDGAGSPGAQTGVRTRLETGARVESRPMLSVRGTPVPLDGQTPFDPKQSQISNARAYYSTREALVQTRRPDEEAGRDQARGEREFRGRGGQFNTESYDRVVDNAFLQVAQNPLSTFSIDVDTASYSNMRRFLTSGRLPPKDSVRIEEMLNYFPYEYAPPAAKGEGPFAAHVEVAECPWQPAHRLVRVALKGKEIAVDKRPASNLVFLIDVSGSMQPENKLPLVKKGMRMLTEQLGGEDRVAIVVYAGNSGMVLPSTPCSDKQSILNALDNLEAGGSTNGAQGIELAYTVARSNFIQGGTNRVILCTDGDFNVGVTNQGDLTRLIEEKARSGVFLSVLGFGMGNLKDSTMEKLADKGNGNYAYIDTLQEARKVLVDELSGTLVTIAKDVKIQIEFNPRVVESYRLIGYENRLLAKEDFNDDTKDAGEIGAGHAVTALYEVAPAGAKAEPSTTPVDALKYQKPAAPLAAAATTGSGEMLTLKLRYKQPDGEKSKLIEVPVTDEEKTFSQSSGDFKFAAAVAGFGMILRDSPHKGLANYSAVREWAEMGSAKDGSGYRREFGELVKRAQEIGGR